MTMVTVGGVRYRLEDAVRLGLIPAPSTVASVKMTTPTNKARAPRNKGRRDG